MTWLAFTIISPILNAAVNYIDKYLIEKVVEGRGIGSLIIFSSLMGLPVAFVIFLLHPGVFSISFRNACLIILNGAFYVAWVLPYLYALEKDEASVVAPLFQMSSIMALILGFLVLGESITYVKFAGCLLVLAGAVGLSLDRASGKIKIKTSILILLGLSCFFISLSGVIFKFIALEESFWVTSFWESLGIFLSSLLLFGIKGYREQFLLVVRTNGLKVISLNFANETIVMIGKVTLNFATLLTQVSVVYFVSEGFQPFFVLAYGILLSIFLPKVVKERLKAEVLLQKAIAIIIMLAGTFLISFY